MARQPRPGRGGSVLDGAGGRGDAPARMSPILESLPGWGPILAILGGAGAALAGGLSRGFSGSGAALFGLADERAFRAAASVLIVMAAVPGMPLWDPLTGR